MYQSSNLYFQKQGALSSQCGKCAVNNLLGGHQVTTDMLNQICSRFKKEFGQDCKHPFGGDYDLNVLSQALSIFEKECQWLENKDKLTICSRAKEDNPRRVGYLINIQQKPNFLKALVGLSDRHWIAVRYYNQQYYVLDSKSSLSSPQHIIHIAKFLEIHIQKGSIILQIISKTKL